MAPTWHQHGGKMGPATSKIEPGWSPGAPKWRHDGVRTAKIVKKTRAQQQDGWSQFLYPHCGRKCRQHSPNSGPRMEPNLSKIDVKINAILEALKNLILLFLWIWEGKVGPRWHQRGNKNPDSGRKQNPKNNLAR